MRSFALFLALAIGACAHAATAPAAGPEATAKGKCCDSDSCPMTQDGVQVVYEDTADGAAMVFTASDVAALQARVAKMAERHNAPKPHDGEGHHGEGPHAQGHHPEGHVAHTARADNTATGARLIMIPNDAAQLEAMRAHVREHVEKMQRGECPMKSCHH